ncbi:MAG: methyltransferase domain-containing protein [Acidimicrobiales bacterium]
MSSGSSHYLDNLAPWDGALYAANTGHHRRYDGDFLATLPLRPTDRVLDIGCGSGDFTAVVASQVPDGHVVGLEPQPSLVAEAQRRSGANQSFVTGPAQAIAELIELGSFDVVISRAVLHWIPRSDHPGIFAAAAAALRPGGALRIECGGGDNVRDIVRFFDAVAAPFGAAGNPWSFRPAGEVLDELLALGLSVERGWVRTVAQRREFDRDAILGWLASQAAQAYEHRLLEADRSRFRAEVEVRVDELRRGDGTYDQTFVRLDVLAFAVTDG